MAESTISVVIPTYNSGRFITEAIESVLRQTHQVDEIIVVDDGSTDNTRQVLEPYMDRIRYVYQENKGPGAARNRGVALARSEWIAFLDSDDIWEPDHIKVLMDAVKDNSYAAMVYGGKKWVDVDGKVMEHIPLQETFPSGWIFKDMFHANYISSTSVVMVRKKVFMEVGGFNENFRCIAEDYDLWIRISALAPIIGVPVYSVLYRRHENNLTRQTVEQIKADLAVLKNAIKIIKEGRIDYRNNHLLIDIANRMKRFYNEAIVGLFNSGSYDSVRSVGTEAIVQGYVTKDIIIRWSLCLLPSWLITRIRNIRRMFYG